MKRICSALLMLTLLMCILPVTAFARPMPIGFTLTCENLPQGTVFVDLLIKLPTDDPMYQPADPETYPQGITADSQILHYSEDDYRSYTFFYLDAVSNIRVSTEENISYGFSYNTEKRAFHIEDIKDRGKIRLAMLDEKGNIIKVSQKLSLVPKGLFTMEDGDLTYDAAKDSLHVGVYDDTPAVLLIAFYLLILAAVHVLLRWFMASLFKMWFLHEKCIIFTGAAAQVLKWIVIPFIVLLLPSSDIPIGTLFLLTSAAVSVGEYFVYRKAMPEMEWSTLLGYVSCAFITSPFILILRIVLMLITGF